MSTEPERGTGPRHGRARHSRGGGPPGGPGRGAGRRDDDGSSPAGENGEDGPGTGGDGGVSRRSLLKGAATLGVVGAAGAIGYGQRETLESWWWRYSGTETPRVEGEVDHAGAEWVPASGANLRRASRPRDFRVDRVVIHMPEATYPVTLRVFQDPAHRAATHYVVRSEDGHVAQMVRELDVAYHAGHRAFNERSVGIEHEGWADRPEFLTDTMYESSARLVAGICARHEIPVDREHIVGHREVPDIVRICPGPHWDWDRYIGMVREAAAEAA
ncbi:MULTISPECIES: N-acetylmuramoyl-L-alanine amidase [Streptomyces]|uniref:N-acetylmuramoyl-L-alanine amidase n=1 Tax=Streptomyces TaxID=1883 RepID=UPI000CD4BCCE|nr:MULTISPECIES: N-acetylmuramoyl-L-alanine amidase [Streptomyces]